MPDYAFKCPNCPTVFFKTLAMVNRNAPQECPDCGEAPAKKVVSTGVGTVLRGDVWPGKNIRIKRQMQRRRASVGLREHQLKMDGPQFALAPNVEGERVDSWEDAAKLAASQGKEVKGYQQKAREVRNRGDRS